MLSKNKALCRTRGKAAGVFRVLLGKHGDLKGTCSFPDDKKIAPLSIANAVRSCHAA